MDGPVNPEVFARPAPARAAEVVTAGNEYLLGLCREDAPDTRSVLAPTPVDTDRYVPGTATGPFVLDEYRMIPSNDTASG